MKFDKYFELAKERGIEPFELKFVSNSKLSINLYQQEVEQYTSAQDHSITGRGIYEGKIGSFSTGMVNSSTPALMIDQILKNAKYGIQGHPEFFIEGGQKYARIRNFHKDLKSVNPSCLIELGKSLAKKIQEKDSRIEVVSTSIELHESVEQFENSKGLKLKDHSNYLIVSSGVQARNNQEVVSQDNYAFITDLSDFDEDKFVDELVLKTVKQFNGEKIQSGKYDVVLNNESAAVLIDVLSSQLSAYAVEHHLSLFEGKEGQKVLSNKLTVTDKPLAKTIFDHAYDDEGTPCSNHTLIEKGVLKTYIYDLETAKKFNKQTTGNGRQSGSKIVPSTNLLEVKKGRLSFEEVLKRVNNGIYITSLAGIGTGINPTSGDYSLQASGYYIADGKLSTPIPLMTIAGNLLTDFNKIKDIASDSKLTIEGVLTPSISLRKLSISGE